MSDYLPVLQHVTLQPPDDVQCVNISIVNDGLLEDLSESFSVSITLTPEALVNFSVFINQSEIFIIDDEFRELNNHTHSSRMAISSLILFPR